MGIKASYNLFFAIPFDTATLRMYERIGGKVRTKYRNRRITTIIGTREVGPSPAYSDIASFKAQNSEMVSQMLREIEGADIIVADLTHNNPNVHFELGIGLQLNKNILRVTGRSLNELGFDIRNLDIAQYNTEEVLLQRIYQYLDMFFAIKDLPLSAKAGPMYQSYPQQVRLKSLEDTPLALLSIPGFRM
jgi:hypothetical protein